MPRAATSVHIRKRTVVVRQGVAKSNELGQKHQLTTKQSIITSIMQKKRRKEERRKEEQIRQMSKQHQQQQQQKIDGDK